MDGRLVIIVIGAVFFVSAILLRQKFAPDFAPAAFAAACGALIVGGGLSSGLMPNPWPGFIALGAATLTWTIWFVAERILATRKR